MEKNQNQIEELNNNLNRFIGRFEVYQEEHSKIHAAFAGDVKEILEFMAPFKKIPTILGVILTLGSIASLFVGCMWWLFSHLK